MRTSIAISIAGILATPLFAQRVLVVEDNGPYPSIQAAANIANVGDTVLIRSRNVAAATSIRKGINIIGAQPGIPIGSLTIHDLPASQRVAIKNCHGAIRCVSCSGTVHLEKVHGRDAPKGFLGALHVTDCRGVTVLDCDFTSGAVLGFGGLFERRWLPAHVENSSLLATNSRFRGQTHYDGRGSFIGSQGMRLLQSSAVFVFGAVVGGRDKCRYSPPFCFGIGPPAVQATASQIFVRGTILKGGGSTNNRCVCWDGYGVYGAAGTTVVRDRQTNFTSTVTPIVRTLHGLIANGAPSSGTLDYRIDSVQPAPYVLVAGYPTAPFAGSFGVWVQPSGFALIDSGLVSGVKAAKVAVPAHMFPGTPVALQAVLLSNGQLELSTPVVVTLY